MLHHANATADLASDPVDLKGLDKPTALEGKCFRQWVVTDGGIDGGRNQHLLLTFTVRGDPKGSIDLFQLLQESSCGAQQREVHDRAAATLGFTDPAKPSPFEIVYKTSSGRRIFT